jgi:uncharacterized protein
VKKAEHIERIMKRVLAALQEEDVAVGLFGSMAAGTAYTGSDVDVAIIPRGLWNRWKLSILREELEEMNVPYKVELVDFSEVSEEFRKHALENVIWWKPR